jgi:hypothetical protein
MGWLMSVEQIRAGNEPGVTNNAAGRLNANGDALKEDYFLSHWGWAPGDVRKVEFQSTETGGVAGKTATERSFLF